MADLDKERMLIAGYGSQIHQKIIEKNDAALKIFDMYVNAEDKEAFAAALIGQCISYYRYLQRSIRG